MRDYMNYWDYIYTARVGVNMQRTTTITKTERHSVR